MPKGRPVARVTVIAEQRTDLESWSKRPKAAQALAMRLRIPRLERGTVRLPPRDLRIMLARGDITDFRHTRTGSTPFKFTYNGAMNNEATMQELPAVFVDYQLSNLLFYAGGKPWTNAPLTRTEPSWPNEKVRVDENWAAFVNVRGCGLAIYFPGTSEITTYRYGPTRNLTTGPQGSACSYLAPTQRLAITPGWTYEYDIWLMIGTVSEIRNAFYDRKEKLTVRRDKPA